MGGWSLLDSLGCAVWLTGFTLETIADTQKFLFKLDDRNEGKFMRTGLWRYSRHPNYFGECMVWIGVGLVSWGALLGAEKLVALATPAFVWYLLNYVSGVPLLEKKAEKKHGKEIAYIRYKKSTNLFVPWYPRKSLVK
jgi:steroid 5-alpha reductase family enzyme